MINSKRKDILQKLLSLGACFFIAISIVFSLVDSASAETRSDDKLFGETLSSRGMAIKDCPSITAQYACMITKDGEVIYERNAYDHAKIASLTKIMTAVITMENCDLDEIIEISKKAVEVGESSAGFWVEDKLDVKSALYAMLVPSGNDAAQALCEFVGQKLVDDQDERIRNKSKDEVKAEARENDIPEEDVEDVFITDKDEAFVKLMNIKAEELGCNDTNFTNPHGLADGEYASDEQYSCAMDIAKITKYAMENDLFRQIVNNEEAVINVQRNGQITPLELTSTDILLGNYEGCIGVKTGNTEIGGPCFSGALTDSDGTEIYTIVLKSEDEAQRFIDTQDLFNWYLTNKVILDLSDTAVKEIMKTDEESEVEVGVTAYIAHSEWIDCKIPVTVREADRKVPVITVAGNVHMKILPTEASGSYKVGDKVAEAVLVQHNREIARIDLVSVIDQPGPNIFQMIGVLIDRIGRNISGLSTVAETEIIANCDKINKNNDKN